MKVQTRLGMYMLVLVPLVVLFLLVRMIIKRFKLGWGDVNNFDDNLCNFIPLQGTSQHLLTVVLP